MNNEFNTIPVGRIGLIAVPGTEDFLKGVDRIIHENRAERSKDDKSLAVAGYQDAHYIVEAIVPRFSSGEAKARIMKSVRGDDVYIMVDVCNYNLTYDMAGETNRYSPDDHFSNLKRVIAAVGGKAKRVNVIMPFLYESRQHRRNGRESMDCALALQELANMGVHNIITFDAHDPRIQNAIPLIGFSNFQCSYQFVQALLEKEQDLTIDADHMMVISPDEGAMGRAVTLASMMGLNVGMFYKRRDYTQVVDGKSPIVAHEYLGDSVEDKDVLIIDDMISSGESMLDVAKQLKARKARKVFILSSFGLFTGGMGVFDEAYEKGLIDRILTTNLIYQNPETLARPYYVSVDITRFVAHIVDSFNHGLSINPLLNPATKICDLLHEYKAKQKAGNNN